jgi:hypothetical protein
MAQHYTGVSFTCLAVYTSPSSFVLANIWEDSLLTIPIANPYPVFGNYSFWGDNDLYVLPGDFRLLAKHLVAGSGITFDDTIQGQRVINGSTIAGTVTTSGTLVNHEVIVGRGGTAIDVIGSLGTTTTVLHGNAAGDPSFGAVIEADITLIDVTTNDASTSKHGFLSKLPNNNQVFLDGTGAYSNPPNHLHGLMRLLGDGATTIFNLLDLAEYLEHVGVDGAFVDPYTFALSSDRSQIVFDSAPAASKVITLEYVIANA